MSYKNVKGILVEIGGDTSALQNALKKVDSATSSLSKELRGINSLLKLDPKNTELLSQKQIVLTQEISKTEENLRSLQQTQKEADDTLAKGNKISQENYRALQQEIIRTQEELKKLQLEASKWTKMGKKAETFGETVSNVSSKVENLGNKLSKVFTTSIAGFGTIAVKSAVDFETAFTGVEKTVDATEEQLQQLKQGIKDMANEIPSTTTEISAVAEAAGQLGIETDNILSFSKAMIDLGNSTNLTSEEAATQLARFANITQMSQKDFDKLGSSIVDLGNNFATTESEIVEMAMRLAGSGKQVGFSEGQILGLATALSSVGIEAEMGGSAISKAMVKMQNSVEMGGNKLDSVLKKAGITLRELELMSTNDTMGFKELAQGIGMTTTEMKQLITAGTNLEDFSKISRMTTEQFKKAWKEDASGALTEFIKGLGNAEEQGESAITMLSEMGLTEVRLRDSLLRAANAGNLLTDAIDTGTKAFKENTALTNEADKRYATLESRFKKTLNKGNNLAISLGEKLTPSINKLLDKTDKFIDKLNNLSSEETENIVKTGLMIASIGPLVKILGTTGNVIGKVSKGVGIFSQAVGVMKTGTDSSNASVNVLAKGMSALISPVGLTTIGVTALVVAFQTATKETRDYANETRSSLETTNKAKESIDNLKASIDNQAQAELYEIDRSKDLWTELQKITDENGKIKVGYENRAKVITNELEKALGIEITTTGDVINNYKELQKQIDKLMIKKKAEIILNASEEKYQEAIKNRTQKTQELLDKQEELNEAKAKEKELQEEYLKASNLGTGSFELATKYKDWLNQAQAVKNLNGEITTLTNVVDGYTQDMQNYEYNFELYSKGTEESLKELSNSVSNTYMKNGETVKTSFTEQIKEQEIYLSKAKELNDKAVQENNEAEAKKTQITVDESNKRLDKIVQELISQTSLVENDEDVENAWKSLAMDSYDKYSQELSKMPPEMRNKIQDMTGIIANDKNIEREMKQLAKDSSNEFNGNIDPEKWGKDIVKLLTDGIMDFSSRGQLDGAIFGLANSIRKVLHFSVPDEGPLSDADEYMPDMINLMAKGINTNKSKLIKSARMLASDLSTSLLLDPNLSLDDFNNIQGKLNNKIVNSNRIVNNTTTIQPVFNIQGSNANEIANEINRQLGKLYS